MCDEVKLASTIDIDFMTSSPKTELIQSIGCLLKAEKIYEYDKIVAEAEKAYDSAPEGKAEEVRTIGIFCFILHYLSYEVFKAAVNVGCRGFVADITESKTKIPKPDPSNLSSDYKPIEIVSYLGITKPD